MVEISLINNVIDIGGKLYFAGMTQGGHDEIYSYDPVTEKMTQVSSLENVSADPEIFQLTNYNGLLAFTFESPATGRELCVVDPVSKAQFIYDVCPGSTSSYPCSFVAYKDNLYFRAFTSTHGDELYSYNPVTGPQRVTDIAPGPTGSVKDVNTFNQIVPYKNGIVFMATANGSSYDLYRYDIYTKQTAVVKTINAVATQGLLAASAEYGGKLYLSLDSGIANTNRMYVYDGVNPLYRAGQLVGGADIKGVTNMNVCGNKLVFDASVLPFLDGEVYMLTDSSVLGVDEHGSAGDVVVYPNPANTEAYISLALKQSEKLNIQLTDMQGRIVHTITKQYNAGKQKIALPVQELAAGIYIYSLMNAGGTVLGRGKLTKQ
jgi:ELWxxDGT repeat protein